MNPNTYSVFFMFWRKASATRKHRPTRKRSRLLRRADSHVPPKVRRSRPRRVSHHFTVLNRIGKMRVIPVARYLVKAGYFKTYQAALGFAAVVHKHVPYHLGLMISKHPKLLGAALTSLKGRWNFLSAATLSVVFNNLISLQRRPALISRLVQPAAKVFSWIASLGKSVAVPAPANANPGPSLPLVLMLPAPKTGASRKGRFRRKAAVTATA
jgi:hypothetical protein